jgi:heme-degrading monooxygenase HmoA
MFIAMNRFKIARGKEQEFIDLWKARDSYLESVPGFRRFNLLQGAVTDDYALFASHSEWESRQSFEDWTRSDAFRKAHANAGTSKGIYLGPPQLELFEDAL